MVLTNQFHIFEAPEHPCFPAYNLWDFEGCNIESIADKIANKKVTSDLTVNYGNYNLDSDYHALIFNGPAT